MGGSTETSAYGDPESLGHGPGAGRIQRRFRGGGGRAAGASRLASDTGGSIRQPAAFCGVTIQATLRARMRYGCTAFASSLDQIRPHRAVGQDATAVYQVIAGLDPHDSTTSGPAGGRLPAERPRRAEDLKG